MAYGSSTHRSRSYYEEPSVQMTREERETLYPDKSVHFTAFSPRPIKKLTEKRAPKTLANIEMNHKLRTSIPESTKVETSAPYKQWLHAGRREPPFPPRWDGDYNSNVWRNFSLSQSVKFDSKGRNITEVIASMYPIRIPPHSELGDYNYAKFLAEVPIIRDGKRCNIAISKSELNLEEFQKLKVRSETRVPPLDQHGHIRPPTKFRRYEHRYVPTPETTTDQLRKMTQTEREIERNLLGTRQKPHYPRIWKLSFKSNNPEYEKVRQEVEERKQGVKKPQIIFYQQIR